MGCIIPNDNQIIHNSNTNINTSQPTSSPPYTYTQTFKTIHSQKKVDYVYQNNLNNSHTHTQAHTPTHTPSHTHTPSQSRAQTQKRINNKVSFMLQNEPKLENVRPIQMQPDSDDMSMLNKTISEHSLLYRMPKSQRNRLIQCLDAYQCDEDIDIFKKGEPGNLFFIIRTGEVQVLSPLCSWNSNRNRRTKNSQKQLKQIQNQGEEQKEKHDEQKQIQKQKQKQKYEERYILKRGDYFGDLALLYASPRCATVHALTKCTFYCISNQIFRKTVQEIVKKNYDLAKTFLEKTSIFTYLSKRQRNLVAYNTMCLRFDKGYTLFREGDDANCFYIVASGRIQLQIPGKSPLEMKPGQSFGENAFQQNQKRSGTAVVLEKSSLLSISRQALKKCLGKHLQEISFLNILKWAINRDQILKLASNLQKEKLINQAQLRECKNYQIICSQGQIADFIVVVLQEKINDKGVGTIFNTEYLLTQTDNDLKITQKLVKNGKGYVGIIKYSTITQILGKNLHLISKNFPQIDIYNKRKQYFSSLSLQDFVIIGKIGEGPFGKVYSVIDRYKKVYSLKCVSKQKIVQAKMQNTILKQKQVMNIVESPFIAKLYKTFKDDHFLYLLTTFIDGSDLYDILKQIKLCNKRQSQFFMGCLITALEDLHDKNIMYRDLKPQNIIIDQSCFLNIVDLSIAKIVTEESGYRTFTVIGTPHYMAPQIMEVQGYTFSIDLWALGVILYEMVCGFLPFGNDTDDPYEIFREIDLKDVEIPRFYKDIAGRQLIFKLLSKNPSERFVDEFSQIKNMRFFDQFDWDSLEKKTIQTPFKLKQKKTQKQIYEPLVKHLKKQKANFGKVPENTYWDASF